MKKNRKYKVAIIGGGSNSAVGSAHIAAILLTNRFEIVSACFSRNEQENELSKYKYNLTDIKLYENVKFLAESESGKIDFAIILTPTDTHFEILKDLFENNIDVICEKALVSTIKEAREIKDLINLTGKKLFVIYNYLGYPMIKEIRQWINNEKLGRIKTIQIEMPQEGFLRKIDGDPVIPQNWRLVDLEIPTISLDLGVHLHILINYLTGAKPLEIIGLYNTLGNFKEVIDDVNALVKYSNDINCNMWFSKSALGHLNGLQIRIYGDQGSIFWLQTCPDEFKFSDVNGNKLTIQKSSPNVTIGNDSLYNKFKPGHPGGFVEALSNYYHDITEELSNPRIQSKKEAFGLSESVEGLKMFQALSKSFSQGKWITIE